MGSEMCIRDRCVRAGQVGAAGHVTVGVITKTLPAGNGRDRMGLACLLYTSDAADERSSVDLGGRRIIKKKNKNARRGATHHHRDRTSRTTL